MMAAFWFLLVTLVRSFRDARGPVRAFVLAGCAALAVGTLQGPVQAFPAVNELLDRGGDAGDVIVNLHAQLNMLAGLMVILMGAALALTPGALRSAAPDPRRSRRRHGGVLRRRHCVLRGRGSPRGERGHLRCGGRGTRAVAGARARAGRLGRRVRVRFVRSGDVARDRGLPRGKPRPSAARPGGVCRPDPEACAAPAPAAVAAYEVPMGLLGFPGVGWLFAGYPLVGTALLLVGPAIAWAAIPLAFTPFSNGPLVQVGWQAELVWLPASTLISTALLYRAHRRRRLRLLGTPPRRRGRRSYRTRVAVSIGAIALLLVTLPFVPAVAGHRRELRPVRVPDRLHARGDGPVPRHAARNDQAVRLVRSAGDVSRRRAAPSRA